MHCTQVFPKEDLALIMALPQESQGHFETQKIEVHYSGVGKINAATLATEIILQKKVRHVLNLGTAGSQKFARGSLVECSGFVQRDMNLSLVGVPHGINPFEKDSTLISVPSLFPHLPQGVCGTGDLIEFFPTKVHCDLVDMEAYAIAKVCRRWNVGFTSIKYITDSSNAEAKNDWLRHLAEAAKSLLPIYQLLCH
jgi:adenosylhomocysteine nucleosidase